MVKKKASAKGRAVVRNSSAGGGGGTAQAIMIATAELYIGGHHLTVNGIAKRSGISRVTVSKTFKDEHGTPTVKLIEDRIIATVLGETRAAIFAHLRDQDPVVAENPLYQLIAVFRTVLRVFKSNPMGRFVAHRLTDLQGNETLALMFSRVDEMLQFACDQGQLAEQGGPDLLKLRLMLFGILRGLLTLLPVASSPYEEIPKRNPPARTSKVQRGKHQDELITARDIEVEFLRIIQLYLSDASKGNVDKYIEVARRA